MTPFLSVQGIILKRQPFVGFDFLMMSDITFSDTLNIYYNDTQRYTIKMIFDSMCYF